MQSHDKSKKFADRMSHRGSGKAVGEMAKGRGGCGASAGEKAVGIKAMNKQLTAASYPHCQSKDGNGGA